MRGAPPPARAVMDPALGRMKELNFPAVLLSIPSDEMPIWGIKSAKRKKGRGLLLHRRLGNVPVQLVRADSPLIPGDPAAPATTPTPRHPPQDDT
jgi:DNA segregation ATPase FtsK/SpoIIIE, S-DNA-T family